MLGSLKHGSFKFFELVKFNMCKEQNFIFIFLFIFIILFYVLFFMFKSLNLR